MHTYLFIDGNYLKKTYLDFAEKLFKFNTYEIDITKISSRFSSRKTFYYDALPTMPKKNETEEEFNLRKEESSKFFIEVNSIPNTHIRTGTQRRSKKSNEQKEVDVLLATDILKYSYRKIITNVVIITGDLDFRPLVQLLVEEGLNVNICCDKSSGSNELMEAADVRTFISYKLLYECSKKRVNEKYQIPLEYIDQNSNQSSIVRQGIWGNFKIDLLKNNDNEFEIIYKNEEGYYFHCKHPDEKVLTTYFEHDYGKIDWI